MKADAVISGRHTAFLRETRPYGAPRESA